MSYRAQNSKFPDFLSFKGEKYLGPTDLYRSASKHKVKLSTFLGRLRTRLSEGTLNDEIIQEALYTDPNIYRGRYGVRKTWVKIDDEQIDLAEYFKDKSSETTISYRTFWQRVKKRPDFVQIDHELLEQALTFSNEDWISFYGGGRRHSFVYQGALYPKYFGEKFHGISAFLKTINRYSDKSTVWSRIKAGWNLDDAVSVSTVFKTSRKGRIYQVTRKKNGQMYIGLTHLDIEQRWSFHLSAARKGASTKIACAIREDGENGFSLEILEDNIGDSEKLKRRECYWVELKGTLDPQGLNIALPGALGSSRGIPFKWNEEEFESQTEAARVLGKRFDIAPHVIERRIREGKLLTEPARKNSKHPDAGTNLFRRWLALKRRNAENIESTWLDYNNFKRNVEPTFKPELRLIRLDETKPWGPNNWKWGTAKQGIEKIHGQSITLGKTTYPSLRAISKEFNIGYSTLKNRIKNQGLSIEEAVIKPIGCTSFKKSNKKYIADDETFRSKRQLILYLAKKHKITEGQAKYRLEKGEFNIG